MAGAPHFSEPAPGAWAPSRLSTPPRDETALGLWIRDPKSGPDAYKLRPGPRFARIDDRLAKALGVSRRTVMRLAAAGFVETRQPTPGVHLLDLDSWQRHLDATDPADNPDYWAAGSDNLKRYLFANGLGPQA